MPPPQNMSEEKVQFGFVVLFGKMSSRTKKCMTLEKTVPCMNNIAANAAAACLSPACLL